MHAKVQNFPNKLVVYLATLNLIAIFCGFHSINIVSVVLESCQVCGYRG